MSKPESTRRNIYMDDDLWEFARSNPYSLSAAAYIRKLLMEEREMKAAIEGYYIRGETVYRVSSLPNGKGIKGEVFSDRNNQWKPINPIEAQFYGRRVTEDSAMKIIRRRHAALSK